MNLRDDVHNLLFGVRRSIRYHNRRRSFYDRFNLFVNAFALIMGSATVFGILKEQFQYLAIWFAAGVTLFSSLNLVIGSSQKARLHHDLSRRFIELEKKIISCLEANEKTLTEWTTERLDIEAEEPPKLHVLDCICHNDLARAMGYGPEYMANVSFYQRIFSDFINIREYSIKLGQ